MPNIKAILSGEDFSEVLRKAQKKTILATVGRVIDDNDPAEITEEAIEQVTKIVVATTNYLINEIVDRLIEVSHD
jgi:hypothetical protein